MYVVDVLYLLSSLMYLHIRHNPTIYQNSEDKSHTKMYYMEYISQFGKHFQS